MKELINQYVENRMNRENIYSDLAKVVSVDDTTRKATVTILTSDLEVEARIQASINLTGGLYIKPTIDSYVVVTWINKSLCFISLYSDIDSIEFQGGENLGIPKTPETVERLNLIEQDINTLKDVIKNWTPVATDGGAALKVAATTWFGTDLTETENNDIQNENFTQ